MWLCVCVIKPGAVAAELLNWEKQSSEWKQVYVDVSGGKDCVTGSFLAAELMSACARRPDKLLFVWDLRTDPKGFEVLFKK